MWNKAHIEPPQEQTPDVPDLGQSPSEIAGASGFADDGEQTGPQARTYGQGRLSVDQTFCRTVQ